MDLHAVLRELGRHADLLELVRRGSESCPEMLSNLNNYAWALATLPEDDLRDGARAAEVIRSAIARAGDADPDPAYLDTLAAALAEQGELEEAIRVGSEALERQQSAEGSEEVLRVLRDHLDAYRAGRAVRDPDVADASKAGISTGSTAP